MTIWVILFAIWVAGAAAFFTECAPDAYFEIRSTIEGRDDFKTRWHFAISLAFNILTPVVIAIFWFVAAFYFLWKR